MNLHEYQSKELLATYGLPVLSGELCYTAGEAEAAFDNLGSEMCVIKAQVHAGGRGKGGGVKLAKSATEARAVADEILGMKLVTPQTGTDGKLVQKVYVESGCNIDRELYLSLLFDRDRKCLAIVASTAGGMEIEEVAKQTPEKIVTTFIDPKADLQAFQGISLGLKLGFSVSLARQFSELLFGLYGAYLENNLSLLEINPLVVTKEEELVILDAKCSVDDDALFRLPELKELMDYDEIDPNERRAGKAGLSYIGLDGSIGCMVNGAGLAMATMDIIKQYGAEPANFLDVGGDATKDTVAEAFRILLSDTRVKAILVNIFGGIMKCDVIAMGVVEAAKEIGVKVPLVVRLQGTNVELGRKILGESGLSIISADGMDDAAKKVVEAVK
ncbi:ADP-forming succinate--CoA ligase subunit beta [Oligoflexia bacterium]|nr:ADP-forming succinate--CoA ligase subunit beta [Oligoflexia bacterium]